MMTDLENWLQKLRMYNGILSCLAKQGVTIESLSYRKTISDTYVLEVALKLVQLEWPYCCMNVMQKMLQVQTSSRTESCTWILRLEVGNFDQLLLMHLMLDTVMML